jgi:hypothetical protein
MYWPQSVSPRFHLTQFCYFWSPSAHIPVQDIHVPPAHTYDCRINDSLSCHFSLNDTDSLFSIVEESYTDSIEMTYYVCV